MISEPGMGEDPSTHIRRLAACDEDLSVIATDFTELRRELTDLRAEGTKIARALSERDAKLGEEEQARLRLEDENARFRQQAEGASRALVSAETQLAAQGQQIKAMEGELLALRAGLAEHSRELAQKRSGAVAFASADAAVERVVGHLRLIANVGRYQLVTSEDSPPREGEVVDVEGVRFVVLRTGRSPLPGDDRPCAFLVRE